MIIVFVVIKRKYAKIKKIESEVIINQLNNKPDVRQSELNRYDDQIESIDVYDDIIVEENYQTINEGEYMRMEPQKRIIKCQTDGF